MATAVLVISFIAAIVSIICFVMIVIAAFEDEIWKGIVGFLFPIYLIYWAFIEYYDEGKWIRIILWLGCGVLAPVLRIAYVYMAIQRP